MDRSPADRREIVEPWASYPARLADAALAAAARPVPAGEWAPSEVVRHLIAVEREVWWTRFASILEEDEPAWSWTEPGLAPGLERAALADVLDLFASERATTVATVLGLSEADWARTGTHATYGRLDVAGLLAIAIDHDAEHLRALDAALA